MSTSKCIIWIDDNPSRKRTADNLAEVSSIDVIFVDVKDKVLAEKLAEVLNGRRPALAIIDHVLDKTVAVNRVFATGSTVAEAMREKWPACPIVGVTASDHRDSLDVRIKKTYDELFFFPDFGLAVPRIPVIARDFARVGAIRAREPLSLVRLLKSPEADRVRLQAALPENLKVATADASLSSRLYEWVQHVLMARAGFLYDELWAATLLGIKKGAFSKVRKKFIDATYRGVFTFQNQERWWVNGLIEILYRTCKAKDGEKTWEVGRRLRNVTSRDYSQCFVCGEPFPEVVGYIDSSSEEQRPMHLRCSILHPKFNKELYFEDVRMMRGA